MVSLHCLGVESVYFQIGGNLFIERTVGFHDQTFTRRLAFAQQYVLGFGELSRLLLKFGDVPFLFSFSDELRLDSFVIPLGLLV